MLLLAKAYRNSSWTPACRETCETSNFYPRKRQWNDTYLLSPNRGVDTINKTPQAFLSKDMQSGISHTAVFTQDWNTQENQSSSAVFTSFLLIPCLAQTADTESTECYSSTPPRYEENSPAKTGFCLHSPPNTSPSFAVSWPRSNCFCPQQFLSQKSAKEEEKSLDPAFAKAQWEKDVGKQRSLFWAKCTDAVRALPRKSTTAMACCWGHQVALRCCGAKDKVTQLTALPALRVNEITMHLNDSCSPQLSQEHPAPGTHFTGCIWQKVPHKDFAKSIEKALSPQKDKYTMELARWWLPLLNFVEKQNLCKLNSLANLFPLLKY